MNDVFMHILYFVNYYDVHQFCTTDKHYYHLLNEIINYKQRLSPFPRRGKCKLHLIPKDVICLKIVEYEMTSMLNQLEGCIDKITRLKLDIVYGDIVELEATTLDQPHKLIYNGTTFEHINYDGYCLEYLPPSYVIVKDLVPLNYWQHETLAYVKINLPVNLSVILDNTTHDNGYWVSFFIYNHYTYYIHFYYSILDDCTIIHKRLSLKDKKPVDYYHSIPINHNTLWLVTNTELED